MPATTYSLTHFRVQLWGVQDGNECIPHGVYTSIAGRGGLMKANRFLICGALLAGINATASDKASLSDSPMTSDQIEVYRVFLSSYTNGSKALHLNLAKRTSALELSKEMSEGGCLKGINLDATAYSNSVVHEFDSKTPLRENITIVDPEEQNKAVKENDPNRTMRRGTPVNRAVANAFAVGLLTLSEVSFDNTHQYAVMSFSFVCGGLCGHGATLVFEKRNGHWKELKRDCGGWIS
jgi:hypothetical protein